MGRALGVARGSQAVVGSRGLGWTLLRRAGLSVWRCCRAVVGSCWCGWALAGAGDLPSSRGFPRCEEDPPARPRVRYGSLPARSRESTHAPGESTRAAECSHAPSGIVSSRARRLARRDRVSRANPGRGRSWQVVAGRGRSWQVVAGRGRSWRVVAIVGGGDGARMTPVVGIGRASAVDGGPRLPAGGTFRTEVALGQRPGGHAGCGVSGSWPQERTGIPRPGPSRSVRRRASCADSGHTRRRRWNRGRSRTPTHG